MTGHVLRQDHANGRNIAMACAAQAYLKKRTTKDNLLANGREGSVMVILDREQQQ